MKCLWITAEPPDRDQGGGNIRQAYLLETIGAVIETHVLMTGRLTDQQTRRRLASVTELPESPVRRARSHTAQRALSLLTALGPVGPPEVFAASTARRRLARAARPVADDVDIVVVNHQALAPLLPRRRRARWVFHPHNVSAQRTRQQLDTTAGGRQRWLLEREAAKAQRLEEWAVRSYDALLTVSDDDAKALTGQSHRRVIVAPNGVDCDRFRPSPLPPEPRLVFTGTMNYLPNVDAVEWFCTEVLPRIVADVPQATLDIVGRHPVGRVEDLGRLPGVQVRGAVDAVAPWLERSRVAVVPHRLGTGTRLKALEALAAGRPIVATNAGVEGLGLTDGVHALVRDSPHDMARAIVGLLSDDDAARALGQAGRALAEAAFDWRRIGAGLADSLVALAAGAHR